MPTFTNYGPGDEQTWGPVMSSADPRFDADDEELTEHDAEIFAEEELALTPDHVANVLCESVTDSHRVDLRQIAETIENGFPCTMGELLVMLIEGDDTYSKRAKYLLREKLLAANREQGYVAERAKELLRAAQPATLED